MAQAATGELCLADPSTSPCPATAAVFSGPVGQDIRIGVFISGSNGLDGFDISLRANHTILTPVGVDLTGTVLLGTPTIVVECLQGFLIRGSTCASTDTIDTLHLAATSSLGSPLTTAPTTGLLFTAIYNITGTASAVPLGFQTGCPATSAANTCVTVANGSPTPDTETVQTGTSFDNSASATMASVVVSANRTSFGPEFPGVPNTDIVTATAMNGFPGFATDSVTFTDSASPGLTVSIAGTNPCSTLGTSCSVSVSLTSAAAGNYVATVMGTYSSLDASGNPDTLVSFVTINVDVVDFSISVGTTSLSFVSGSTASDTVTLTSQNGFSGTIAVSVGATSPAGLNITLSSPTITLFAGESVASSATFKASPSTTTTYHAIIRATSGSRVKTSQTITIQVVFSGSPDFSLSASPNIVSTNPGISGTSMITVTSTGNFNSSILLTSQASPGLTCSLSPGLIIISGTSTLACAGSTGTYNVTVTGNSGSLSHTVSILFKINSGPATGLVCIANAGSTSCPPAPPLITSPVTLPPPQVRVAIVVDSSRGLDGFDITLLANSTILKPAGVDLTNTILLGTPVVLLECLGGRLTSGSGTCANTDNANTIHLVATSSLGSPLTTAPTTGLLFTAIYNVTGTTVGTTIGFQTGCSNTSVSGGICVTIPNGTPTANVENIQTGLFANLPTFSLQTPSPAKLIGLAQGSSGSFLVNATSLNGFSGVVAVTGIVSPMGPTVTISPSTVVLNSTALFALAIVTVSVGSNVPQGNYTLTVTGTSGTISHSLVFALIVSGPDFAITLTSPSLSLDAGQTSFTNVTVTSLAGFSGTISFTTAVSPSGLVLSSIPSLLLRSTGANVSRLVIVTSNSTRAGTYTVTITGTSRTISHVATLTVNVEDFRVTIDPGSVSLVPGGAGEFRVQLQSLNQFSGTVSLTPSQSGNISAALGFFGGGSFQGTLSIVISSNENFQLLLQATASTAARPGNYTVTLTARGSWATHTVTIVVVVVVPVPPPPDFTITASPSFISLPAGTQGNSTITLQSINGFQDNLTLSNMVSVSAGFTISIQPSSVILTSGSSKTVTLLVSTSKTTPPALYTITVVATNQTLSRIAQVDIQVLPPPDIPPVAIFAFSPINPIIGQTVEFNGTSSFDPDGFVRFWIWNFGDGSGQFFTTTPMIGHIFFNSGNYSVTLTVQDNAGLTGSKSETVNVIPRPAHDVSIVAIFPFTTVAVSSQRVPIEVAVTNNGADGENVSITVYANSHPIATINGLFLQSCSFQGGNCNIVYIVQVNWDTTGTVPGTYTISATIFLPAGETDPTPQDNSLTDGTITILPPPVIVAVPSSGTIGTKVTIEGSGFPVSSQGPFGPQFDIIQVTFDDMNLGFATTTNGTFTFVLDIPQAQPGPHLIKAFDITGAHTNTSFQVLPPPGNVNVTVDTGTIYFPGDNVTVYVLTTLNGTRTAANGVKLTLVFPNGTITSLKTKSFLPGVYTASFKIPSNEPTGTYSIVATAQIANGPNISALSGFEVKTSWLSSHTSTIVGSTAVAGVLGLAGVAWSKGYFRRKNGDDQQETKNEGEKI